MLGRSKAPRRGSWLLLWWGGRVVEGSGLENRRGVRVTVGSNPTPTACILGLSRGGSATCRLKPGLLARLRRGPIGTMRYHVYPWVLCPIACL